MRTITTTPGALRFIEREVQIGSDMHRQRILQQEWLIKDFDSEHGKISTEWRDVPLVREDKKDS